MSKCRLHLDSDTSSKALYKALLDRGHDVTRTPSEWIKADARDEEQLLKASAQGRCIFTFNIHDYMILAQRFPRHGGIILAAQSKWTLKELIDALDRFLSNTEESEAVNKIYWLNVWR